MQLIRTSSIDRARDELKSILPDYELINDCVSGERSVKGRGPKYLPIPDPDDNGYEGSSRYKDYKNRAVFYNVTQRTLRGLTGEIFGREPIIELPTALEALSQNANGAGLTLSQLAKRGAEYVLSKGRGGILADYPAIEGGLSVLDVERGEIQPNITIYDAVDILNWRVEAFVNKSRLTLLVLKERYDELDDGLIVSKRCQYRVLRIIDDIYTVEIYRNDELYAGPFTPKDASGRYFSEIPFSFIGAENNDDEIDHPPLLDLAQINIAHYRNSADYEEGVYMAGQPTPVFSGLTEDWVENVLKGQVRLGARGAVLLPNDGDAELLQMRSNTAAFEAMEHKEKQMIALGAKLVEEKKVQRTATEANIAHNYETSILSNVANNVSTAIEFALKQCAKFVNADEDEISFKLNTDFNFSKLSPQERQQLIAEWQGGAISFTEMRSAMRKSGYATLTDEEAIEEMGKHNSSNSEGNNLEDGNSTSD